MSAKKNSASRPDSIRNSKVHRDYFVGKKYEAGIMLSGTEVKSVRQGHAQIADAFVRVERGNAVLHNARIDEYAFGNINNHPVARPRKLLLHRNEIHQLRTEIEQNGNAIIPTRIYFKQGLIKVEVAVCKGKKLYDKREDLKKKAAMKEMERAMKFRR